MPSSEINSGLAVDDKHLSDKDKSRLAQQAKEQVDALVKAAAELTASMPGKEPTCVDLWQRVKSRFSKEDDMLRFVAINWIKLPTVIPIVDRGPGFYISAIPIRRRDCLNPVPHDIRVSRPIPNLYDVKNKLVNFEGIPSNVTTIVSRTTGRLVMEQIQASAKRDMREDAMPTTQAGGAATMIGGSRRPSKGKSKAGAKAKGGTDGKERYRPRWWEGMLIVLGTKPTPGERAFYKWAQCPDAPVPTHLYANGDVAGLNAARSLVETFEIGHSKGSMANFLAEWQGGVYRDLIASRKAHDRRQRYQPDPVPFPGTRLIEDEPESVQDELDKWCEVPEPPTLREIRCYEDCEAAAVGPLGQTARDLRDDGAFYQLIIVWDKIAANIARWAEVFQEGIDGYHERMKGQ